MTPCYCSFTLALLLAATLLHPAHAQTCSTSWTEVNGGSWYTAANWDNGVPGAAADACITLAGTYTVTVGDFTVNSLTLGAASGTQTLQSSTTSVNDMNIATTGIIGANGVLEWNNAILESGMLTNQGLVRIPSAGGGRVRGATTVFRNEATVEHVAGAFGITVDGRVENASVWDVQGDVSYPGSGISGGGVFVNEAGAVFQKTAGTGSASFVSIGMSFDNRGTIDVQSGELAIGWPSTHTDAVLTTSAGATLHFTTDAAQPSATFIGTNTGNQEGLLRMRHPFAAGADAVWNFTGNGITWDFATLTSGTLTNQGLVRIAFGSTRDVNGATSVFRNEGTVEHMTGNNLQIRNGGRVENASVWDVQGDNTFLQSVLTGNSFVNESGAVFQKSAGTGAMRLLGSGIVFENFGTIDVQAGEITIELPSTHTNAVLTTSAGATLRFLTGVPPATFIGTTTGNQAGDLIIQQDFAASADAVWAFTGNPVTWRSGLLTAGMLTSQTPIRITETTDKGVDAATFRAESSVVHEDGTFIVSGDGRLENASVWDVQGNPDYAGATGAGTFVNEAGSVFQKTAGTGITTFTDGGFVFENAGTVSIESGELDLDRPFDHQGSALIQGTGIFDVIGSTFTHSGDTGPGLSPGILTWQGTYAMGSTATLHIEIVDDTGDGTGHDLIAVTGDADVTQGTLTVTAALDACTGTPPCDFTILTFTGSFAGPFSQEILPPSATVIYPTDANGVAGEVFLRINEVVPVELVSFERVLDGEVVRLIWETASETNNAGFEIQRISKHVGASQELPRWQEIGWVDGHGTTIEAQRYGFIDAALPFGVAVVGYRLKQIDYDGTFAYSPEVEVSVAVPSDYVLYAAYPNPFNPHTTIGYALPRAGAVRLAVYDVLGQQVALLVDAAQAAGEHEVPFFAGSLSSGTYFYQLEAGAFRQTRRFVLLK